jgi:ribosome maturation factor RimP
MAGQETVLERVRALAEPILATLGFELVELEYKREGRGWILRFFLDKEGGITLDDCADASREIGMLLEVEDVIPTAYDLEVSSPGIDRPLKKAADFERFKGSLVKIKTYERLDPDQRGHLRKTFVGTLLGLEDGRVRIEQNDKKGGVVAFTLEEIALAQLEFEF